MKNLMVCMYAVLVASSGCARELPEVSEAPAPSSSAGSSRVAEDLRDLQQRQLPDLQQAIADLNEARTAGVASPLGPLTEMVEDVNALADGLDQLQNEDEIDALKESIHRIELDHRDDLHRLEVDSIERVHEVQLDLADYKVEVERERRQEAEEDRDQEHSRNRYARISTVREDFTYVNEYGVPVAHDPRFRASSTGNYLGLPPAQPVATRTVRTGEWYSQ